MELTIIIAVAISIGGSGTAVWLTNRHITKCMERMNESSEKRTPEYFDPMESGFLKHFTALFYASDKTSKEHRTLEPKDFKEGLEFAEIVGKM